MGNVEEKIIDLMHWQALRDGEEIMKVKGGTYAFKQNFEEAFARQISDLCEKEQQQAIEIAGQQGYEAGLEECEKKVAEAIKAERERIIAWLRNIRIGEKVNASFHNDVIIEHLVKDDLP